jgi:N-methylhydantoinase B/oxoprolinase/acetone carboxylase alpha subunit
VSNKRLVSGIHALERIRNKGRLIDNVEEFEIPLQTLPAKVTKVPLKVGEVLQELMSGGGGLGAPSFRDPRLVEKDVREGKVSIEQARASYHVVMNEKTLALDVEGTRKVRSRVRKEKVTTPKEGQGEAE